MLEYVCSEGLQLMERSHTGVGEKMRKELKEEKRGT